MTTILQSKSRPWCFQQRLVHRFGNRLLLTLARPLRPRTRKPLRRPLVLWLRTATTRNWTPQTWSSWSGGLLWVPRHAFTALNRANYQAVRAERPFQKTTRVSLSPSLRSYSRTDFGAGRALATCFSSRPPASLCQKGAKTRNASLGFEMPVFYGGSFALGPRFFSLSLFSLSLLRAGFTSQSVFSDPAHGFSPQLALLRWGFSQSSARNLAFWAKGSLSCFSHFCACWSFLPPHALSGHRWALQSFRPPRASAMPSVWPLFQQVASQSAPIGLCLLRAVRAGSRPRGLDSCGLWNRWPAARGSLQEMGEKTRFSRDHLWKPAFLWNIFAVLSTVPGFSRSLVCCAINSEYFMESIFSSDRVLVAQFPFVTPT